MTPASSCVAEAHADASAGTFGASSELVSPGVGSTAFATARADVTIFAGIPEGPTTYSASVEIDQALAASLTPVNSAAHAVVMIAAIAENGTWELGRVLHGPQPGVYELELRWSDPPSSPIRLSVWAQAESGLGGVGGTVGGRSFCTPLSNYLCTPYVPPVSVGVGPAGISKAWVEGQVLSMSVSNG